MSDKLQFVGDSRMPGINEHLWTVLIVVAEPKELAYPIQESRLRFIL